MTVHIDDAASPCHCGSTRAQYTMPTRGAGSARRLCLNPSCRRKVWIDAAADVARKVAPSLELTRKWWIGVYG